MSDHQGLPLFPHVSAGREVVIRSVVTMVVTVVGCALLYALIPMRGELGYLGAVAAIAAQLGLIPLTMRRARAVAASPKPIATAVEAIVLLLALLIFGFSAAYVVLADQGQMSGLETKLDAVYFSITTLATVGYGDIHAQGQGARVAVSIQMLFDLIFIAVAVRLMTTIARDRVARAEDGDRPEG